MFGRSIPLFKLVGFEVRLDLSWIVIAVLVTWSLAECVFPRVIQGLDTSAYWWMGVAGAIGLFGSIILHEFGHAIVARRQGIQMQGITLFIFGGVARMGGEPPNARAEFLTAIGGPIVTLLLAGIFACAGLVVQSLAVPPALGVVLGYLATINLLLLAFNLVPAFPLDGGRVLRSALWAWKKNLRWATRVASAMGSGFGYLLIGLGVFSVVSGNFIGGLWWFLLGLFIINAAQASYQQVMLRQALEGEPLRHFMHADPISVPLSASVDTLVEEYIYRHHHKMFPVVEDSRLIGCVSVDNIKGIPRAEWGERLVREVASPCSDSNTIEPGADAVQALSRMRRNGTSRLLVVEHDDHLVGIVSLRDLLRFIALKLELEGEESPKLAGAHTA